MGYGSDSDCGPRRPGDQLYFSRAFKRRFGEAPSAYRERLRGRVSTQRRSR